VELTRWTALRGEMAKQPRQIADMAQGSRTGRLAGHSQELFLRGRMEFASAMQSRPC
jgi:hypothetical protein